MEKGKFWGLIGKLGVLLTIAWIIIQMFNHFNKDDEIQIKANGNHYPYTISIEHNEYIKKYKKVLALNKAFTDNVNKNGTSIENLIKFESSKKAKSNYRFKSDLNSYLSYNSILEIPEYNEIWSFKIENTGIKPLEDLVVELPFKGYYRLNSQKGKVENSSFENRITIGNLAPGYSVNVYTWIFTYSSSSEYTEEKTRVTHRYGWEKINYPVKVKGIFAWNERNDNILFEILIPIVIIVLFVTFMFGISIAPKLAELEKKRKLKALEELEELKKIKEKKEENNNE